jgi:hypothetical protein
LCEGYAAGIPPHSMAGLLNLEYPTKNWKIIAVSQFTVKNAEKSYSVNYTIEQEEDKITIMLNGENVEFYKYFEVYKWFFPVRENVSVSGNLFPYGHPNQTIVMESYNLSDYLLMFRADDSRPYVSVISIQDIIKK